MDPLRDYLLWGGLGVQVFFVISGFVIPYSMYKSGYKLSDYPRFLLKRLLRLYPVLCVTLLLTAALSYGSAQVRHAPAEMTGRQFIDTLFTLTNLPVENVVFWTLRIEVEYYLLIGLFFPFLRMKSPLMFIAAVALFVVVFDHFAEGPMRIFGYTDYFIMGIVVYRFLTGIGSSTLTVLQLLLLAVYQYSAGYLDFHSMPGLADIVGLSTALLITFWHPRIGAGFTYLGTISYSLYTIHVPVGSKFINFFARYSTTGTDRALVMVGALVLEFAAGIGVYYLIERRSVRWANAVKYRSALLRIPAAAAKPTGL